MVLNGLPRHVGQAEGLESLVDVRVVVHLSCTAEDVVRRIASNVGGDRTGRVDDDLAAVRRKLAVFAERTAPLLDHYRSWRHADRGDRDRRRDDAGGRVGGA